MKTHIPISHNFRRNCFCRKCPLDCACVCMRLAKLQRSHSLKTRTTRSIFDIPSDDEGGDGAADGRWTYGKGKHTVVADDSWETMLSPAVFINNGLVDFYALWLLNNKYRGEADDVYVFGTEFFNLALSLYKPELGNSAWDAQAMRQIAKLRPRNGQLHRQRMWIFPICNGVHYVMIVVRMPHLAYASGGGATIMWFDSLNGCGTKTLKTATIIIRNVLADVHIEQYPEKKREVLGPDTLPVVELNVPQQPAGSNDCGPYILYFLELLLQTEWGFRKGFTAGAVQELLNANSNVPNMRRKILDAFQSARSVAERR